MKSEEHIKRYMGAVYARCLRHLGDPDLAWDALQEVMMRFTQVAEKEPIEKPLGLLYKITGNCCADLQRSTYRMKALLASVTGYALLPETSTSEERLLFQQVVARFGEEDMELLVYRYVEQMTFAEIGEVVGMSDRGVQKKIERMTEQVRKYLKRQEG